MTIGHNTYKLKSQLELLKYTNIDCNSRNWSPDHIKHVFQVNIHHELQVVHHQQKDNRVSSPEQHHKPIFNCQVHVVLTHGWPRCHDNLVINVTIFIFMDHWRFRVAAVLVYQVVDQQGQKDHDERDAAVKPAVNGVDLVYVIIFA